MIIKLYYKNRIKKYMFGVLLIKVHNTSIEHKNTEPYIY